MNIEDVISAAFQEDIGSGDHTSLSTIPKSAKGSARLIVKDDGVIAGIELAKRIFNYLDKDIRFKQLLSDGDRVKKGDIAFIVEGSSISLLTAERTALNFMQRMSGIATHTRMMVDAIGDLPTKVLDTRKTTPLLREIEKWAVRIGGGQNHRFGLFDMIMIKDNHIDFAGGISNAISSCHDYMRQNDLDLAIEIETRNIEEIEEVISVGGVHRIMLDNFSYEMIRKALILIDKRYETEASGGITLETVRAFAECGVDYVSVGSITHQIKSLDLSLKAFH
jgi:nicotinate-nucleotide pyrophosphorylase (carboxylating)